MDSSRVMKERWFYRDMPLDPDATLGCVVASYYCGEDSADGWALVELVRLLVGDEFGCSPEWVPSRNGFSALDLADQWKTDVHGNPRQLYLGEDLIVGMLEERRENKGYDGSMEELLENLSDPMRDRMDDLLGVVSATTAWDELYCDTAVRVVE